MLMGDGLYLVIECPTMTYMNAKLKMPIGIIGLFGGVIILDLHTQPVTLRCTMIIISLNCRTRAVLPLNMFIQQWHHKSLLLHLTPRRAINPSRRSFSCLMVPLELMIDIGETSKTNSWLHNSTIPKSPREIFDCSTLLVILRLMTPLCVGFCISM